MDKRVNNYIEMFQRLLEPNFGIIIANNTFNYLFLPVFYFIIRHLNRFKIPKMNFLTKTITVINFQRVG